MLNFPAGLSYPFRALSVLAGRRELWIYVAVPILLNIVIAAIIYAVALAVGLRAIDALALDLPEWATGLRWLLRLLLVVVLLAAVGYLFVRFGVVIGSPWYDRLSRRLEMVRTGRPLPPDEGGLAGALADVSRALRFEVQKLLLLLGVGLPILLLNLVPVAGSIAATIGGIALGATIACLDFLDPPLSRRRLGFRSKLGTIGRGLPATAGFGLICFGLTSIPFVNLLSIPVCIAAGTLFFADRLRDRVDSAGTESDR